MLPGGCGVEKVGEVVVTCYVDDEACGAVEASGVGNRDEVVELLVV